MNTTQLRELAEAMKANPGSFKAKASFELAIDNDVVISLLDRINELEDGLNALLAGCEYRSIGGDTPAWHTKQMPSTAALDTARTLLEKSK